MAYYSVDHDSPVYFELQSLVEKTAGMGAVLAAALEEVEGIELAFVFGSVARGEARSASDIDLAVVGNASFRDVVNALGDAQLRLGREINPVVWVPDEMKRRIVRDDPFIREVIRGKKLFIIGTEDDFRAVVKEPLAG